MIIKRKYYSNPTLEQKEYGLKNSIRKQLGKFVEKGSDYYRKKINYENSLYKQIIIN